jgi:branched-chain amino acid transport system substrate-binding protein
VLATVAATAVAGLTACSSNPHTTSSAKPACVSPGVTDDTVELGLITASAGLSGSTFLPFRAGVDARLGVENDRGGVGGRTIMYDWRDDESSPGTNNAVARQLVREGVFGVVQGSTASAGSADYLRDQGVPVTGTATDPTWTDHPNMVTYSTLFAPGPSITTWGDFVRDHHGSRAAVLSVQTLPSSIELANRMRASLTARGVAVPLFAEVPPIEPNLDSLAAEMAKADIDTIVAVLDSSQLPLVVKNARNKGLGLRVVLSPTTYDTKLLHDDGATLAGSYSYINFQPFEANLPAHRAFLAAMARYAPEVQPSTQQIAINGWIAADMIIRGLKAAPDCPTREAALKGIRSIRNYDADGLLLHQVNLATSASQTETCFAFVQVTQDGAGFSPLDPTSRCGQRLAR